MQFIHLLGINISKRKIDLSLSQNKANASMITSQFSNHVKGYKSMLSWLQE
jgi:hypothetical protein